MSTALNIIMDITLVIPVIFISYYMLLSLLGFSKVKQNYSITMDRTKFCIFVPCHNEEGVIGATVENLSKIQYNPELYDVFFLADNCKDNTAKEIQKVIEEKGLIHFHVLERFESDPNQRGKPHALQWGIARLEANHQFYDRYDMFMILDADNFVDSGILQHFNSQYHSFPDAKKPCMIQCYLDSKNANSVIARGYNVGYRISNRFFQHAKSQLGLNCAIGGTGFAITTSFLKELGGFKAQSLTEDLEIQTIATIQGKPIAHNFHVRIYDEKPTGFKQSLIQKTRWAQGHWWNAFHHSPKLIRSLFHRQTFKMWLSKVDNLLYLFTMLNYGIAALNLLISVVAFAMGYTLTIRFPFVSVLLLINLFFQYLIVYPAAVFLDGTKYEKRRFFIEYLINVVAILLSGVIFTLSSVGGLFKHRNQKVWVKTVHSVTKMDGGASSLNSALQINDADEPITHKQEESVGVGTK